MAETIFLTLAEVIEIHSDQMERYGGSGVRDNAIAEGEMNKTEFAKILRNLKA